jgi:hypothetical protein
MNTLRQNKSNAIEKFDEYYYDEGNTRGISSYNYLINKTVIY